MLLNYSGIDDVFFFVEKRGKLGDDSNFAHILLTDFDKTWQTYIIPIKSR